MGCEAHSPGILWKSNSQLALALSASMPSGDPAIVLLRNEIIDFCGLAPAIIFRPLTFPIILEVQLDPVARANFIDGEIYIGSGHASAQLLPSPWGSPFGCESTSSAPERFAEYAASRADTVRWLAPLVGRRLVCHCCNSVHHASVIAHMIMDLFAPLAPPAASELHCLDYCMNEEAFRFSETFGNPNASENCNLFRWDDVMGVPPQPSSSGWPELWCDLVDSIRDSGDLLFWELFSGSATLSKTFAEFGLTCAPPIDAALSDHFNLLDHQFLAIVIGLILEGRFSLISLEPPYWCRPGCGDEIFTACAHIVTACRRTGSHVQVIMPEAVPEWSIGACASMTSAHLHYCGFLDTCLFGTPWSLRVRACGSFSALNDIHMSCQGDHAHSALSSRKVSENTAFRCGQLWPGLCRALAECYVPLRALKDLKNVKHLAGFLVPDSDCSIAAALDQIGFVPASKKATSTVGDRVSSCMQPSRRVAPTLIPEGLGPAAHLSVALTIQHPFLRQPSMGSGADAALASQPEDYRVLIRRREKVTTLLSKLKIALDDEWANWAPLVHERIRPIVSRRHVPFCRELSHCTSFIDNCLWPAYVLGLRMTGWAEPSFALPSKLTTPVRHDGFATPTNAIRQVLPVRMAR